MAAVTATGSAAAAEAGSTPDAAPGLADPATASSAAAAVGGGDGPDGLDGLGFSFCFCFLLH